MSAPCITSDSLSDLHLNWVSPQDPGRSAAESFIQQIYRNAFSASVETFSPLLVGFRDHVTDWTAVAGCRYACDGPLYLERYLDEPIEVALSYVAREKVLRNDIVEVGQLAAARVGDGRRLIGELRHSLADQGYKWAVCTFTRELRRLFSQMGLTSTVLVAALSEKGVDTQNKWGEYYKHQPVVVAGRLDCSAFTESHG